MRDRRRWGNVWRLHVPLAVALAVCGAATLIEFSRATEGHARAWAYTVQWPLFGAFAVWMWVRYRREDSADDRGPQPRRRSPFTALADRWRADVARAQRDAGIPDDDPDLVAWRAHVADLRSREARTPERE